MMLRASAMTYAVAVSLLIGLVCSGLLMYSWLNMQAFDHILKESRLIANAESGLAMAMASDEVYGNAATHTVDLFKEGYDSVIISKRPWGIFQLIESKAQAGKHAYQKTALVGASNVQTHPVGLYLADVNRPLKVCGQTELRGSHYLPAAGIERAYVEGQTYAGSQMYYGQQKPSTRNLPEVNERLLGQINHYLEGGTSPADSAVDFFELVEQNIYHSFEKSTILIDEIGPLPITEGSYRGNIIFRSRTSIFVGREAHLQHVLMYAPEITFEEGFSGQVQAFATDRIATGERVNLSYPSVLAVIHSDKTHNEPSIEVGKASQVQGLLLAWIKNIGPRYNPFIRMEEASTLSGQLYCKGNTELRGAVAGSVYTHKFYLKTTSSTYENLLLNATIDADAMSPYMAGCDVVNEGKKMEIIDWL